MFSSSATEEVTVENITRLVVSISEEVRYLTRGRLHFHNIFQRRLIELAYSFGLNGIGEYHVPNFRDNGRDGRIDVAWFGASTPVVLFELDSSRKKKSIQKLLAVPVQFRFWVYYGSKDYSPLLTEHDPDGSIAVIRPAVRRSEIGKVHNGR